MPVDLTRFAQMYFKLMTLILGLILVRALYLFSHPFFVEGDGFSYYKMMLSHKSSLLFAPGYSFFMSVFERVWSKLSGLEFAIALSYLQPVLQVVVFVYLFQTLKKFLHAGLSCAMVFVIGVSPLQVSSAGTSRPEFFQAIVAILLFTVCVNLYREGLNIKRLLLLSFIVYFSYITKYNCIVLLPFVVLLALKHRAGLLKHVGFFLLFLALWHVIFTVFYHKRTTRSFHLNLEKGWILVDKLALAEIAIEEQNGLASMRFLALIKTLPKPKFGNDGLWSRLNVVEASDRLKGKETYDKIFAMSKSELSAFLIKLEGVDVVTNKDFEKIYYWVGLNEGEEVTKAAFFESISRNKMKFLSHVLSSYTSSMSFSAYYDPYIPKFQSQASYIPLRFEKDCQVVSLKDSRFESNRDWISTKPFEECWDVMKVYGKKTIYVPIASRFYVLAWPEILIFKSFWIILILGVLVEIKRFVARKINEVDAFLVSSVLVVLGGLAFSALVFRFRQKELIFLEPFIVITYALILYQLVAEFVGSKASLVKK